MPARENRRKEGSQGEQGSDQRKEREESCFTFVERSDFSLVMFLLWEVELVDEALRDHKHHVLEADEKRETEGGKMRNREWIERERREEKRRKEEGEKEKEEREEEKKEERGREG
jgi:hypothetical protein